MVAAERVDRMDGLQIHTFTAGEFGSPVILLHGGGTDSAMLSWRLCFPRLAETHRVYAPDWPGYGASSPLATAYSNDALVMILRQLMDAWALQKASLVGISMGGSVALGYSLAFPERVDRLVPVDSYGLQEKAPSHRLSYLTLRVPFLIPLSWASLRRSRWLTRWALQRIFHDPQAVSGELVEEVFQAVQSSQAHVSFYSWQRDEVGWHGLKTNYVSRLGEITAPTLVIHGENDALVPVACARRAAERIPNARLLLLDRCGHWPQRERPEEFNDAVSAFLA